MIPERGNRFIKTLFKDVVLRKEYKNKHTFLPLYMVDRNSCRELTYSLLDTTTIDTAGIPLPCILRFDSEKM